MIAAVFLNTLLIVGSLIDQGGQLEPNAIMSQREDALTTLSAFTDPMPMCQFTVPHMATESGEYLVLCGSIPELGRYSIEAEYYSTDSYRILD